MHRTLFSARPFRYRSSLLSWFFVTATAAAASSRSSLAFSNIQKSTTVPRARHMTTSPSSSWTPGDATHAQEARDRLQVWPLDEYNAKLLNEVHPRDFVSTTTTNNNDTNDSTTIVYDWIAIGAGAGGLVSAKQAARRGATAAMISQHLAGGDCLTVGCVPSKALLRSAKAVAQLRKAAKELGIVVSTTTTVTVDFPKVMERLRKLRSVIAPADGHAGTEATGAHVVQGRGRLTGPNTLQVTNTKNGDVTTMVFRKCVLATGGRPRIPKTVAGLSEAPYTTNQDLFNLQVLPPRMIVLGAGVTALEMAQAFALLGSQVTVINRSERLFASKGGDVEAAQLLQAQLQDDGVTFLSDASLVKVETLRAAKEEDSTSLPLIKAFVEVAAGGGTAMELECECLLVAVGRLANVEDLGLEAAGVAYEPGQGVLVNDLAQSTTNPSIYAVGDCVAGVPRLTHMSGEMAKLVVQNALAGDDWKLSSLVVPAVAYTEPEYATVGIASEDQAKKQGIEVDVYRTGLEHNDRAILEGATVGFCKIVTKKGTDEILGATIVAERAGEMINEVSLCIKNNIGLYALGRNIHAYPTTGEAVQGCGVQYINSKLPRLD